MTTPDRSDPYLPLDEAGRDLLPDLLDSPHGAFATLSDGLPLVTRVACLWTPQAGVTLLLSDLSEHARALRGDSACSILVGQLGGKGDPLTHPRLTLVGLAAEIDKDEMAAAWQAARPKTMLYFGFTDFRLWRLEVTRGILNAGFGQAYRLTPDDLPDG